MEVEQLRKRKGLSRDQVEQATGINKATLYRIETAQARPQMRTFVALLDAYDVTGEHREGLINTLKATRVTGEEGWLQVQENLPGQYATYIGFESEAIRICDYESSFVPGLLQTEAYARTVISAGRLELSASEVEDRVSARMARQRSRPSHQLVSAVIDEAVLCRRVGPPEIMQEQLQRLLDESEKPSVSLQVIPFDVGVHPGMQGAFAILQFDPTVSDIVYIEAITADLFLDGESEVRRYNEIFDRLQGLAVSPEATRDRLAQALTDLK
ncbi:helix-turn-helix transcriptional regulator [Streptosporangium oxazolinicum]|uniref:Helix-turn-helix transcriptional regulator n=1 Tax=Streptosporangium oxazolinicum TaxID=909287 RepID=A0ABP8A9U2_9ACTN